MSPGRPRSAIVFTSLSSFALMTPTFQAAGAVNSSLSPARTMVSGPAAGPESEAGPVTGVTSMTPDLPFAETWTVPGLAMTQVLPSSRLTSRRGPPTPNCWRSGCDRLRSRASITLCWKRMMRWNGSFGSVSRPMGIASVAILAMTWRCAVSMIAMQRAARQATYSFPPCRASDHGSAGVSICPRTRCLEAPTIQMRPAAASAT